MLRTASFVALLQVVLLFEAHAQSTKTIAPLSGPWEAGSFEFAAHSKKTRKSVSGIACPRPPGTLCLVAFDEGTEARYVTLSPTGYTIDNTAVSLRKTDDELDAEGAATDGRYVYVTGSHSAKRKTCESNPGSRHVIRLAIDPASGKANPGDYKDSDALWHLMSTLPTLADHVGEQKCLGTEPPPEAPSLSGQRGVNVEGLAVKHGFLHFGFRGPAENAMAPIVTTNAIDFFGDKQPNAEVTFIEVGGGRGIRDLAAVKDGILVLAGPDDDAVHESVGWVLGLWDGKPSDVAKLKYTAKLDLRGVKLRKCDDELKPEALAVLRDDAAGYEVVIMSDGLCDGGPLKFMLPRAD